MSKILNISDLVPEVQKIMDRAKDYGLETEVIAQMIQNSFQAKPSEVIDKMWGALEDWDIPSQNSEDEYNNHLNKQTED